MQPQFIGFVALACLALMAGSGGIAAQARGNLLPDKIAAMYTGWISPNQEGRDLQRDVVERMLDPLAEGGFTAFYAKFQPVGARQFDLSDPEQFARVKLVADACAERDLALVAYTYHFPHRGRDPQRHPEHADYEPLVMASGSVVEDRFAPAEDAAWRHISGAVFELARASLQLPIAAVGIDVECLMSVPSYNDAAWADFAAERGLDANVPAEQRGSFVAQRGLTDEYRDWYSARWDAVIARWCDEIHAINPHLSIAVMPAHHPLARPFYVHAGSAQAPAIIDNWGMYNGSGLTEDLLREQDRVKALNPHNRFVLWLRPDSYRTRDIRVHAYHTLMRTDGYCNWHIGMLLPGAGADAPASEEVAQARWEAYAEANERAQADIAAGREEPSIPLEPVEPLVADMDVEALATRPIPQLAPVGDGSGDDRWIPTRELQHFLIYARGGDRISIALRHLAGQARPLALQYALVTPTGEVLRNEAVAPGAQEEFVVDAPHTGTYALWVTGGAGGQAWYAARVHNPHHAFPFRSGGGGDYARFFYTRALGPLELWLTRSDPEAPARLNVSTGPLQAIRVRLADGEPVDVLGEPVTLDLPPGADPIRVRLENLQPLPHGFYVQLVRLRVEGAVHPYLSVSPERRLLD